MTKSNEHVHCDDWPALPRLASQMTKRSLAVVAHIDMEGIAISTIMNLRTVVVEPKVPDDLGTLAAPKPTGNSLDTTYWTDNLRRTTRLIHIQQFKFPNRPLRRLRRECRVRMTELAPTLVEQSKRNPVLVLRE
jgi:hypothetical protein